MLTPDQYPEGLQERLDEFENEARKIGFYFQAMIVVDHIPGMGMPSPFDNPEEQKQLFMLATMLVGNEAFDNRVLEPEKHQEDTTFRSLVVDADPVEELRKEIENQLKNGKNPLEEK